MKAKHFLLITLFISVMMPAIFSDKAFAQENMRKIHIAKLEIYPASLTAYKAALALHAKTAVKIEPGVLSLQAVYHKADPTQVTVFEVYASEEAYQAHLKSPHFLRYKTGTMKMVKSLQLFDCDPIAMEIKPELALPIIKK